MISPSDLQNKCIQEIREWFFNRPKQWFYVAGYAGSGKSSILPHICETLDLDINNPKEVRFGTFTNKAAQVLRKKGMENANTIHSLIYKPVELENGTIEYRMDRKSALANIDLLIIDECSMINEQMARDILSFGTKVLVTGDPGQLEPVEGQGFFTLHQPDFFLNEIHRQALENPIILVATMVRNGEKIPFGDFGEVRKIKQDELTEQEIMKYDQILTGKNQTRRTLNTLWNELHGFTDTYPTQPGQKLICTKNLKDIGLFNGIIFHTVTGAYEFDDRLFRFKLDVEGDDGEYFKKLDVYNAPFLDGYTRPDKRDVPRREYYIQKDLAQFDYGGAITVHKSQGSQWDSGIVFDDGFGQWDRDTRMRWLYTALTRFETRVIIAA